MNLQVYSGIVAVAPKVGREMIDWLMNYRLIPMMGIVNLNSAISSQIKTV